MNAATTMSVEDLTQKILSIKTISSKDPFRGMVEPVIYTHPNNLQLIRSSFSNAYNSYKYNPQDIFGNDYYSQFMGIQVIADKHMNQFAKEWKFPHDRFVEYERSDEPWCRYCGIGHEGFSKDPLFLIVDKRPPVHILPRRRYKV